MHDLNDNIGNGGGVFCRQNSEHAADQNPGFLIFGGTSEGRKLAEFLSEHQILATVCVATEYGEEVMPEQLPGIRVRTGRMDESAMETFFGEMHPLAVADATHPYAKEVTENIRRACGATGVPYYRLLRGKTPSKMFREARVFDDCTAAADWLEKQQGNILLTTGLKELPEFAARITDRSRIYARTLLQKDVFAQMEQLGLSKKQMICMQGPFHKEMNVATIHMTDARFLVTKESGENGGFAQKVEAARETGAVCVVIRRPEEEEGYSLKEMCEILSELWGEDAQPVSITLVGIGMGGADQLTQEAAAACRRADCIIGAGRMLDSLKAYRSGGSGGAEMISLYKAEEIVDFVLENPQYLQIVVAFSGDVGFYSGAKPLLEKIKNTPQLDGCDIRVLCGIPSVAYFAARLCMPWEDMVLVSMHGREQNLVSAVQKNEKVFTLAGGAASIRAIAKQLDDFGLGEIRMYVGADLSYPTERIEKGTVRDFLSYDVPDGSVCVAVFEHPCAKGKSCVHGIPDGAFIRGEVPMTKEEVRCVSISKLRLTRDAVVYDIGAGTGSVAVECARVADRGKVYAIEEKEEAQNLIAQNRKRFALSNLEVVAGRAPGALEELPAPTHVFIGGSGGELRQILGVLLKKNPDVRVVVNCITLETLGETIAIAPEIGYSVDEVVSVSIAKSKKAGSYHMMTGQNPVYVITLTGGLKKPQTGE